MQKQRAYLGLIIVGSLSLPALGACGAKVAISDEVGGAGGTTSSTSTSSTTSTWSTTTSTTSTSTTSTSTTSTSTGSPSTTSSSGSPSCAPAKPLVGPCAPSALCASGTNGSTCLSQVDQSNSLTPGLRMSALRFTKPAAFTTGIVSGVIEGAVTPNNVKCNLNGSATFSWLLRFDLATGTLTTGGSKPAPSSAGPYAFINQTVSMNGTTFHVQPITLTAPLGGDCTFNSSAGDLVMPMFLDAAGMQMLVLPLRATSFSGGHLSGDHGCIGRFNAEGLDPLNACLPDTQHPDFLPGADVSAFIALEDADAVIVTALNQSLCVLLSQDAQTYGKKNAMGMTVCKRDAANHILFTGDWCSVTNQGANGACADAMRVQASFAAQGVMIQ